MERFYNINTFALYYDNDEQIPDALNKLCIFTSYSKLNRNVKINEFENITINNNDNYDYIFNYNNKENKFSVLSDYDIQSQDKKTLESSKRIELQLPRTLKLACSLDLINTKVVMGNSILGIFEPLILFQDKGIDKVIDYARNIVMNKEDYYDLFKYTEINTIDKYDLYRIYFLINKFNDYIHIYEYLLFTKEIFGELSKKKEFKFLEEKYDTNGINKHNYLLFGDDCDSLFFNEYDVYNVKYSNLIKELDEFTEKPTNKSEHIIYDKDKKYFVLNEEEYGFFTFDLLSDMIDNIKIKEKLLSNARYHDCHNNAIIVAKALNEEDKKSSYVVGGKIKANEKDYYNHSWVEIDESNLVIDFNHNIIMNRDKYYKLYEAKEVCRTLLSEIDDIIMTIVFDADLLLSPIFINYFGKEIMNDLNKNEKIIKKYK